MRNFAASYVNNATMGKYLNPKADGMPADLVAKYTGLSINEIELL